MSNTAWALQVMFKYRLQIDFSQKTIDCRGMTSGWYWDDDNISFYDALHMAILDIERT